MTVFLLYFCRAQLLAEEVWMIDGGLCQESEKNILLTSFSLQQQQKLKNFGILTPFSSLLEGAL
jgi:hypothetical protein